MCYISSSFHLRLHSSININLDCSFRQRQRQRRRSSNYSKFDSSDKPELEPWCFQQQRPLLRRSSAHIRSNNVDGAARSATARAIQHRRNESYDISTRRQQRDAATSLVSAISASASSTASALKQNQRWRKCDRQASASAAFRATATSDGDTAIATKLFDQRQQSNTSATAGAAAVSAKCRNRRC